MQYILTEEEYTSLNTKSVELSKYPKLDKLQKFCTDVAENLVLKKGWAKGRVWGCVITETTEYCNDCPSKEICPYPYKHYSK